MKKKMLNSMSIDIIIIRLFTNLFLIINKNAGRLFTN